MKPSVLAAYLDALTRKNQPALYAHRTAMQNAALDRDPTDVALKMATDVLGHHNPNTPITTAIPAADSPTKSRRLVGWRVRWVCADLDIRSGITTLIDAWRIARELRRSPKNEGVRIVRVYLRRGK